MKIVYRVLTYLGTIIILNFLATWIFVSKNKGEKYIDSYISSSKEVKIKVKDEYFEGQFSSYSYLKRIIIFKGIFGGSSNYTFQDEFTKRYYKIVRFDKYGKQFSLPQTSDIDNQELYVKVDPLQINNPSFGTKENPVLVFSYKGVNKELKTDIRTDEIGNDGFYINKEVLLSPTKEEYRYNVEQ